MISQGLTLERRKYKKIMKIMKIMKIKNVEAEHTNRFSWCEGDCLWEGK